MGHPQVCAGKRGGPPAMHTEGTKMKFAVPTRLFAIAVTLILSCSYGAFADDCGRPLTQVVKYALQESHPPLSEAEAILIRVDQQAGKVGVTISHLLLERDPYFDAEYRYEQSWDNGRTWRKVPRDTPSTVSLSNLVQAPSALIQAPSTNKIVYKELTEVARYLRSEDEGNHWVMPKYVIDEPTPEQLKISPFSVLAFHLVGIHPQNPMVMYARIAIEPWASPLNVLEQLKVEVRDIPGLFISNDGGETWTKLSDAIDSLDYWGIPTFPPLGISPSNPKTMFGVGHTGVMKSIDGGVSWAAVGQQGELQSNARLSSEKQHTAEPEGPRMLEVLQFAVDPNDEDVTYIVSNKGLFRTTDGGKTWVLMNLGFDELDAMNSLAFAPLDSRKIYAGTARGLLYSPDRGCNFEKIYPTRSVPVSAKPRRH